jgi:hypothetical protein
MWGRGTKVGGWDPGAARPDPDFSWDAMLSGQPDNLAISAPRMPSWAK